MKWTKMTLWSWFCRTESSDASHGGYISFEASARCPGAEADKVKVDRVDTGEVSGVQLQYTGATLSMDDRHIRQSRPIRRRGGVSEG